MTDVVDALWVAPYEAQLPDKTVLVPHETVVEGLPRTEAEGSDNWKVLTAAQAKKLLEKAEKAADVAEEPADEGAES